MKSAVELPRRVESARNALITYIQDNGLTTGDRLPPYAKLRAEFGFGSQTIAAAVDSLCSLGMLEVRDKVGLFVADPHGGHLTGRTVAVAIRNLAGSAYAATLAGFIQKLLSEKNCRCLTFFQSTDPTLSPCPALAEFPGLEQAVFEHRCDGIISLCQFSDADIKRLENTSTPCCFIGDDDQKAMPLSVVIEVKRFISDAAKALNDSGCTRLVQLCASDDQLALRGSSLPALVGTSYSGGVAIAEKLLALPPEKRPDGIVSDDDTIVSGLLAGLISKQLPEITYLPQIATIIHAELNEKYPSDRMILFRQDIEKYASLAVELLLNVMRGEDPGIKQLSYRFEPVQD
ncbi:MAG: GntR family transcriptional regulator [Lentisphaerae bacterium]|nr:GntR family transcriptional regulator [Lentisphaerota bacterium]